jgi:hypothetical protein
MVHFGRCPRVHCQGQPALPVGQSDLPRMHTTKIYCCRCEDIYYPRSSRQANVDGAYFGTTFCHLFLQSYWELQPQPATTLYVPRIFGFKLHRPQGAPITSQGRANAAAALAQSSPHGSGSTRGRAHSSRDGAAGSSSAVAGPVDVSAGAAAAGELALEGELAPGDEHEAGDETTPRGSKGRATPRQAGGDDAG